MQEDDGDDFSGGDDDDDNKDDTNTMEKGKSEMRVYVGRIMMMVGKSQHNTFHHITSSPEVHFLCHPTHFV